MARQVNMIEQNQRHGIDHRADEADHRGDQDQRAGFVELHGDTGDHGQQQQEKQIPFAISDAVTARKKAVDAIGMGSTHGVDGGEPGVGEKSRGDDQKKNFSPPTPARFEEAALHHGDFVALGQETFGKEQRIGEQAGQQGGDRCCR